MELFNCFLQKNANFNIENVINKLSNYLFVCQQIVNILGFYS